LFLIILYTKELDLLLIILSNWFTYGTNFTEKLICGNMV